MEVFELVYQINEGANIINMFEPIFARKYRRKLKFTYNNKLGPLPRDMIIDESMKNYLKVKIISYFPIISKEIIKNSTCHLYRKIKIKANHDDLENMVINNKSKMMYNIPENPLFQISEIKIFGDKFVEKNKDKCKINYKNKIYPLKASFSLDEIDRIDEKLEIILIEYEDITDKSFMFYNCDLLEKFEAISPYDEVKEKINMLINNKNNNENNNNINLTNKFYLNLKEIDGKNKKFYLHSSEDEYSNLPLFNDFIDIMKWNSCLCTNMKSMFHGCKSLISLSNISEWDTSNVIDMSSMFEGCSSLISLPDLSKWNTNKLQYINSIFSECSSLTSLPDISKWNISNIIDLSKAFKGCSSLVSLPNISNWNTNKVTNMSCHIYMRGYSSIKKVKYNKNHMNKNDL